MVDFPNNPLRDPNFVIPDAPDPLIEAMEDPGFIASAVLADREGNNAADQEFIADIMGATRGQLIQKYGVGVADRRGSIQQEISRQREVQNRERTNGQIIGDTVNAAASSFVGMVGSGLALTTGVAGAVDQAFDSENTGLSEYSARVADTTKAATDFISSFKSDALQERQALSTIEGHLDSTDNRAEADAAIANGENEFLAGLTRIGKDAIDAGERILSDGAVAGDVVANALGSLGPSAKLASAGGNLFTSATARVTTNATALKLANTVGIAAGVGASEAAGTYTDTIHAVMGRSEEEMKTSEVYNELVAAGVSPEEAQVRVATMTATEAAARQFPTAAGLGLLSARFNASPLTAFNDKSLLAGLREVGSQALEEGLQGASAQFNQNLAVQGNVDDQVRLADGVGEQLATGAIGGVGMAAGVGAVIDGPRVADTLINAVTSEPVRNAAREVGGAVGAGALGTLDTVSPVLGAAASVAGPLLKSGVQAAGRVVAPAVEAAQDINARPNAGVQNANIESASKLSTMVTKIVTTPNIQLNDAMNKLSGTLNARIPGTFAAAIPDGANLIESAQFVMQRMAEPDIKINRLDDADVLFVADIASQLSETSSGLPPIMQVQMNKVLSSPDFKRVQAMAAKIDLNESITPDTPVSPETIDLTIKVASSNPANINVEHSKKILEQNVGEVSSEEVKIMKTAIAISQAIDDVVAAKAQIGSDNKVTLTQDRNTDTGAKTKSEKVKRSIRVSGFVDRSGKSLRSINDFAADIMKSAQSPKGELIVDGYPVKAKAIADQFGLFLTHMTNKTEAMSKSAQKANEKGKGPSIGFASLIKGEEIVAAGDARGSRPVFYDANSPRSVEIAQELEADTQVTAKVYNALAEAFPDLFPSGPVDLPKLNLTTTVATETEAAAEVEDAAPLEEVKTAEAKANSILQTIINKIPSMRGKIKIVVVGEKSKELYQGDDANGKPDFAKAAASYSPLGVHTVYITENTSEASIYHEFRHVLDYVFFGVALQNEAKKVRKKLSNFLKEKRDAGIIPDDVYFDSDAELSNGLMSVFINDFFSLKDEFPEIASMMENSFVPLDAFTDILEYNLENTNNETNLQEEVAEVKKDDSNQATEDEGNGLPDGVDAGTPGAEQTLQLFHGTGSRFDKFDTAKSGQNLKDDSGIFFTNNFKLAIQYSKAAGLAGKRDYHVLEATVDLKSPLEINSADVNPDLHWYNNRDAYSQLLKDGDHDGAIVTANDGEITVVALNPEGITILSQDSDGRLSKTPAQEEAVAEVQEELIPEEAPVELTRAQKLPEIFSKSFTEADPVPYQNSDDLIGMVSEVDGADQYVAFAKAVVGPIMDRVNTRLSKITVNKFGKKTISEIITNGDGAKLMILRDHKAAMFINPTTGEYDADLLSMATMVVVDWLSAVRAANPSQLEETMDALGLTYSDIDPKGETMALLQGSVPVRQATELMGRQVLKVWGMKRNPDAPMVDSRGSVEGLVKEIISALNDGIEVNGVTQNLISIKTLKGFKDGKPTSSPAIDIRGMKEDQKSIGIMGQQALTKVLAPETLTVPSIGQRLPQTDQTQSRGNVKLSAVEKKALKTMQDTPHMLSQGVAAVVESFGYENLKVMLGYQEPGSLSENHPLRASIMGKNLSIERDFDEAMALVSSIETVGVETPVYYPVSISKVGRHQFKGVNPQNNKILRALVTPTHSTLDMTDQKQADVFWLTVAQASDLRKVENEDHGKILSEIQQQFSDKFGGAVDLIVEQLKGYDLDFNGLASEMGTASMAEFSAIVAVAQLRFAESRNNPEALTQFETTLSFELDGKTDGSANMMSNFGQGELTEQDMSNFNRVGFFLGRVGATLNQYFSKGNVDLYNVMSKHAQRELARRIAKGKPEDQRMLKAIANFAVRFGELELVNGEFEMTRNTSKSPMTKTVYGSGVLGVSSGIAQDMMLKFYKQASVFGDGANLEQELGYPGLYADMETMFGSKFGPNIDWSKDFVAKEGMKKLTDNISKGFGEILSQSAKSLIGDKITQVNDTLVLVTNVQTQFLQTLFQRKLEELAVKRVNEGKLRTNSQGKPIMGEMTQRDYDSVVNELRAYAPLYNNGTQTLAVGSFEGQVSESIELSSNMTGNLRAKSTMERPALAGVKVIPYLSIGRGDAMMMNGIYSTESAPLDTLNVFDGIDMPISKIQEYAQMINGAVLKNWDADILGDVVQDFEGFLNKVGSDTDILNDAFRTALEAAKDTTSSAKAVSDLLPLIKEMQRQNQARKKVFKRIAVSVDHMGGSNSSYVRGGKEVSREDINRMIRAELEGRTVEDVAEVSEENVAETAVIVTDSDTVLAALSKETRNKQVRDTVKALMGMAPVKVVMGSIGEINQWRIDNLSEPGLAMKDVNGMFDIENNVVFVLKDNHETIAHELIHAATFSSVLAHYEGSNNDAVVRLEGLLSEFMGMDFSKSHGRVRNAANKAQAAIVKNQTNDTAFSKAAALNEFMAWTLTNEALIKELKNKPTTAIDKITKTVKALMQRLVGGVPKDMFTNILFNTLALNEPNVQDTEQGGGNDGGNQDGELSPAADRYTNFWIGLVREKVNEAFSTEGEKLARSDQILRYKDAAKNALRTLDFGGFSFNGEQKATFSAIHVVIASEARLDAKSQIAMGKMFDHIVNNLTPEMFGPVNAQDRFSTVMSLIGDTKNDNDVSDALGVVVALSQTSNGFRKALDQLPQPKGQPEGSEFDMNDFLGQVTGTFMNKLVGSIETAGSNVKETMDALAQNLIEQDSSNEFRAIRGLMTNITKADTLVSGAFSVLAGRTADFARDIDQTDRSALTKFLAKSVAIATAYMDSDRAAIASEGARDAVYMGVSLPALTFIPEFVQEIVGTDSHNAKMVAILDRTNRAVQSVRQAFREDLPVILQNAFSKHPDAEQWATLHQVLGQNDFSALFDLSRPDATMALIKDESRLAKKIEASEKAIQANYSKSDADNVLAKAQQLADFMNGNGAGHQLIKNAYAINKLATDKPNDGMVSEIDQLVSMYALQGQSSEAKQSVTGMYAADPEAVKNLIVYMQGLNKVEDEKVISEEARLNGLKGYIPNAGKSGVRVIIEDDSKIDELTRQGFVRVGDFKAELGISQTSRGYYVTDVKQGGAYSQGVMQTVQSSYRGVDTTTGLTLDGSVSGVVSFKSAVQSITDVLVKDGVVADPKEVLIPVWGAKGPVMYERAINPDITKAYLQPKQNLALMLGSWAGRQVEEIQAEKYNREMVRELKRIYDNRNPGEDKLYVDLSDSNDIIHQDTWRVMSPQTKEDIKDVFGEGMGFPVRKDMLNLTFGYREASILDVWSGKTRMPEGMSTVIQAVAKRTMGDAGVKRIAQLEDGWQGLVSSAKDLIVVRSLIVPYLNTQANVFQLTTRGVGFRQIMKGYQNKFAEIEQYNENAKKLIELDARIALAGTNKNRVAVLTQQKQSILDQNKRMSIAPLIEAGAYKNISEGITDLDVDLTSGRLSDWIENQVNRLPKGLQTAAKYGMLSKDTALYKGANKAVQYGDFIAKSIYFDHLTGKEGMAMMDEQALSRINEEFVNFSVLPGRTRSYLESMGLTWFLSFKIRIMKIAIQQMRENPVRSLITATTVGALGSPINDNLASVVVDGRIDYALGPEMLFGSPNLNPWAQVMEWAE